MRKFREIHAICFSARGEELCARLAAIYPEMRGGRLRVDEGVGQWCAAHFAQGNLLIFVGALGICVRSIAPFVRDKTKDPAVVCLDERGTFAISVLSGHIGGANEAAREIAGRIGATAVVTTATDINGRQGIDEWAAERGMTIANSGAIKAVNAKIAAGGFVPQENRDYIIAYRTAEIEAAGNVLCLIPRVVCVGVGCRKGSDGVSAAVEACLCENGIDSRAIASIASIDLKHNEAGIIDCAKHFDVPFVTYSAEELNAVSGGVSRSDFVRATVGVDCVCESAALCAAGQFGANESAEIKLIAAKRVYGGVTVALAIFFDRFLFQYIEK